MQLQISFRTGPRVNSYTCTMLVRFIYRQWKDKIGQLNRNLDVDVRSILTLAKVDVPKKEKSPYRSG